MRIVAPVPVCAGVFAAASTVAALHEVPALPDDLPGVPGVPAGRRDEHLAARALLRQLVREVAGSAAAESPIAALAHGKPYLVKYPQLGVSISHSGGWVAAAISTTGAVGVDVQVPVRAAGRLLRRCCTPSARAALACLPQPQRDVEFSWIWSVQEACVKATGAGIGGLPWTIPVEAGQRSGRWQQVCWSALREVWPTAVSCAHAAAAEVGSTCSG